MPFPSPLRASLCLAVLLSAAPAMAADTPPAPANASLAPVTKHLASGKAVTVVPCYPQGAMHAYCISFDDGVLNSDGQVLDALRKRKIPATFFINSLQPWSADAIKSPQRYQGFEIGSHGAHHKGFDLVKFPDEALSELTTDQKILGTAFHCPILGFAYPHGGMPKTPALQKETDDMLRKLGFLYARGVKNTKLYVPPADFLHWDPDNNVFQDIDQYLAMPTDQGARSFMAFTHSGDFLKTPPLFDRWQKLMDRVAAEPRLWKATMLDFTRYITALRALQIVDQGIFNPSDFAVWVTVNGKPVEIPARKAIRWQQLPIN